MKTPDFFSHIPDDARRIYNMPGSSVALFFCLQEKPFLAVEQTEEAAKRLYDDIRFFRSLIYKDNNKDNLPLFFLPEPGGTEAFGKRAEVMNSVAYEGSVVTSVNAVAAPLWHYEALEKSCLFLTRGKEAARDSLEPRLNLLGYRKSWLVVEKGEYSIKGWLVEIFPSTLENPVRIEFFGDEIDEMKLFDIESQRSLGSIDKLAILPAEEPPEDCRLPFMALVDDIGLKVYDLEGCLKTAPAVDGAASDTVLLSRFDFKGEGVDAELLSIRGYGIYPEERKSLDDVVSGIERLSKNSRVVIVLSSHGQTDRLKDILFERGLITPVIENKDVLDYIGAAAITIGNLSSGLYLPGMIFLTEKEIFGERPAYKKASRKSRLRGLIASIDDISPGDLIVHRDHGIGRFIGMQRRTDRTPEGVWESELLVLEYRGGDRLYIPIYNIDRVKKYNAEEGVSQNIDRLGSKSWQGKKERVKKALMEMTEKLLTLYAERELAPGFSSSADTELHRDFDGFFPYEETPDQLKSIEEILADMRSERPMDRLVCGDVGYGKTEVAMRAAFRAVFDNRQVAVLVPTTILCEQHYLTFKNRFSAFPIRIDFLSRFKPKKEQDLTFKSLAKGEIDIIIATHGLLRKDLSFNNLGLLVIDEEHKFGVAQKEKLKEIKKGVDILSLTATPIPRTLQMAFSGLRGMSVIETPPEDRLAVRSIVAVFSEEMIKEAIERELKRGGQVLFVHNFIADIEKPAAMIKRFFPDARLAIGHGQMQEKLLEEVMLNFIKGGVDILVSTTIIGSGIDIPTANTIIINRADKIGLADLYQLRGRVGRSDVRAYAYFLIPGEDIIGDEAKKRLQAIKDMSFLGAGFRLAMKDMEIRGAGNLLGHQQSGHIHAVGFDMYVEMLERVVAELKGQETKEEIEPSVTLNSSAFIPETFIEDLTLRLSVYRRISNAGSQENIEDLEAEITERFGKLPEEVKRLMDIMRLKTIARKLLVTGISEGNERVRLVFSSDTNLLPEKITGLQRTLPGIRFLKDGLEFSVKGIPTSAIASKVYELLKSLL